MDEWWQRRMLADATSSSDLRYRMWNVNQQENGMAKLYRKKQMIEIERWSPGIDMAGVSVSDADKANGSPKTGDVIARNSDGDPKDRWLISQATFERTYEPF
jgi:hypothetical protein